MHIVVLYIYAGTSLGSVPWYPWEINHKAITLHMHIVISLLVYFAVVCHDAPYAPRTDHTTLASIQFYDKTSLIYMTNTTVFPYKDTRVEINGRIYIKKHLHRSLGQFAVWVEVVEHPWLSGDAGDYRVVLHSTMGAVGRVAGRRLAGRQLYPGRHH